MEGRRSGNSVLVYPMNRDVHPVEKFFRVYERRPLIGHLPIFEVNDSNLADARKGRVCGFNIKGNEIHDLAFARALFKLITAMWAVYAFIRSRLENGSGDNCRWQCENTNANQYNSP